MYTRLKVLFLGILLLSTSINAKASYTNATLPNAAPSATGDNSSGLISRTDTVQIVVSVIFAPVVKERLVDPLLRHFIDPIVDPVSERLIESAIKPFWGWVYKKCGIIKSERRGSQDMSINDLYRDREYYHLSKYLQRIDGFLTGSDGWDKRPLVRRENQDDLIGYRYIGGGYEVSIVEGRAGPKKTKSCLLHPDLKSKARIVNQHPFYRGVLDFSDNIEVNEEDAWDEGESFPQFLGKFFEILEPIGSAYFKKILTKDSSFIIDPQTLPAANIGNALDSEEKKEIFFNEQKDRLYIFFHPKMDNDSTDVDIKPGKELHYMKIKRVVRIEENE